MAFISGAGIARPHNGSRWC